MSDFFHGWRRKAGFVTLLMAIVFMAGWVRSMSGIDVVMILITIPYWSVIWPLGCLSAYLILWPGKPKPKSDRLP
jgi:hypothetical protein